jgi:hypothetical protein
VNEDHQASQKPSLASQRTLRSRQELGKRKVYKFGDFSDDEEFNIKADKKGRKRDTKRKMKAKKGRFSAFEEKSSHKAPKRAGSRPVLEGVSIFELIIPWKTKPEGESA